MARDYLLLAAQRLAIAAIIRFAFYSTDEIALALTGGAPQPIGNPIVDAGFFLNLLMLLAAALARNLQPLEELKIDDAINDRIASIP